MSANIFINARFLTQPVTGVQRYAREVVKALDHLIEHGEIDKSKYRFTLLSPRRETKAPLELKHIPLQQVGFLSGHAWEQLELPLYSRGGLLINLCNTGPLLKDSQVVTIHDAGVFAFPEAYSFAFRVWYRILFKELGKRARKIITVSSFSKNELIRFCGIDPEKIEVIYEGKEQVFSVAPDYSILEKFDAEKPFILAVSSLSPHKNFQAVVRAIELLGHTGFQFVIAGGVNPKVFKSSAEPLPGGVIHLGYVSDGQLWALYEKAACFVYPSFYEGFGLPPLEAMACGCPVIVSEVASLPEICGDAALYCNPHSASDIADKVKQVMNNAGLRQRLRQKGLERVKMFTWLECARKTFELIKTVLNPY
ncbi:group 1 glycosyl transferase [Thermincola ferriacetica]|uniref:Group 1 glycosyl transferase n=1 Tax=Thermincola ferriacetica TaxID=281456 RepID=A0A0L6W3L2_9FIRM|nr:glycosyltransferase family 1 protein [Thermincola ferriacetica]KNZ70051.1 group 1 glycosyl transferase [Thermincola ferriacetica]